MPIRTVRTIGKVGTIGRRPYSQLIGPPTPGRQAVKPLNRFLARALEKRMDRGIGDNSGKEQCPEVDSTAINVISYNSVLGQLRVTFKQGRSYNYFDVSGATYRAFCEADSKGKFFNANIRNKYAYARLG